MYEILVSLEGWSPRGALISWLGPVFSPTKRLICRECGVLSIDTLKEVLSLRREAWSLGRSSSRSGGVLYYLQEMFYTYLLQFLRINELYSSWIAEEAHRWDMWKLFPAPPPRPRNVVSGSVLPVIWWNTWFRYTVYNFSTIHIIQPKHLAKLLQLSASIGTAFWDQIVSSIKYGFDRAPLTDSTRPVLFVGVR